jgi:hypothetical protein
MISNPVIHRAAMYPRNPKKIEQIVGDIELTNKADPIEIPAIDIPNADRDPKPA